MATFTGYLRARSDDELVALLVRRPDLATPHPATLASLAARTTSRSSLDRALTWVDALVLQVLEAVVVLTSEPGAAETTQQETTPTAEEPAASEQPQEEEPQEDGPPPAIASIRTFDPTDAAGERVENVELAIDGDPSTFWFSFTYTRPDFGGLKEGMGLELTLAEETLVSGVKLQVNGTGGNVEVRATTGDAPTQGDLLASGTLSQDTVLDFAEPVRASTLVLYFTELPTNAEGQFRIEVTEVTVS